MAEGKKFSERKSRLQDFNTSIGGGGGQTQQTQQDDGSQQTGKVFDTPISLDIPRSNRSGKIELPGITTQYDNTLPKTGFIGAIEQGKVQGNVVLPGINDRATRMSEIDPHEAVQGMIQFQKDEDKKLKSQYGLLVKRGVKQIGDTYSKWANANLSKEGILEKLARIGETNGASKKAMQTYIDENEAQTNAYNKKVNDAFSDWEQRNMDMNIMKQYEGETISGLLSRGDGKGATYKLIKGLSENLTMLPEMVVTMLAPQVGLPLIASDVYIQEAQGTYEEMLENGATYEQAQNGATLVGMLNASVELLLERFLGGVQRAGASFLRRLFLKNAQKEVVRNLTKKGFAEILGRGLLNQSKTSFVEGLEEIVQQLITNAFVKTVNPDRDLGEGLVSSFDQAFWQTFFMPLGGGSDSIIKDYQNNKKVDLQTDIEALNYVMEGEERKAQRMQQAKERMKQRFLNPTMDNGYTPSEEQAEQRANEREENEEFEDELKRENQEGPNYTEEDEQRFTREGVEEQQQADELRSRQNEEVTLENEMAKEALSENINEDLGDPRYQKIDEDLQDIKDSLEKMDDNTFFNRIMSSINKGNKSYVVTTDKSGNKSVLRVVERGGNGKGSNGKTITVQVMKPSKKSGNVSVSEFTYTPGNLTIDQKQGIITGFENWGKTGNFRDNTAGNERYQLKYEEKGYKPGVAGKNEKSISGKEGVQQRNKINDETIEQLAKKYGVRVEVIKGLIKVLKDGKWNGKDRAYGMYLDQVLTLSEQIKESTAPHELLHAIFDMIDPETKAYLISQVMKSEGWDAKTAEEWLADTFSNFFRTGKIEGAPKSTWGKIKIFFKRVRSFINGLGRWRSELEEIFTDIITAGGIEDLQGKIDRSEKLNEAKARMKKRFMEYAKNAEKVQKKAKSQEKYQNTGKNEENEYTNSGQRSSSLIAGKISVPSAPFSFNTRTIEFDGEEVTHKYDPDRSFITNYTFSVPQELQQYVDLFNRAIENGYESAIIGEFDGKYIKIYFDKNFKDHFEKHGGFAPENLIMTLNRFDLFSEDVVDGKKRYLFEKELPNGRRLIAVTSTNLTEISFYESKTPKIGRNGKFQLAGDIESEAFKKRFGDSKVVDKDGNPLVVYHGTPYGGFTVFKNTNRGSIGDEGYFGRGWYFTNDKASAKDYSDEAFIDQEERTNEPGAYGNVEIKEVYLKIENPYVVSEKDVEYEMGSLEKLLGTKNPSESTEKLKDEGYDGVIYEFNSGTKEYTVFEPNQIKSATDNVGIYDPNNDDIRYQTVYHGSPYDFDKFDSSHMGEGEGAQAHGWGHYVAVEEKTGRHYAELNNREQHTYKLKARNQLYGPNISPIEGVSTIMMNWMDQGKSYDEAYRIVKDSIEYGIEKLQEHIDKDEWALQGYRSLEDAQRLLERDKQQLKAMDSLKESDFSFGGNRNLYEVDIPDPEKADTPTGWNYIEEKPHNSDSNFQKSFITEEQQLEFYKLLSRYNRDAGRRFMNRIGNLYSNKSMLGEDLYRELSAVLGGDKEASKFLESLGYKGIHYYGGRDGEAYVIFNDDDLEITNHEKYQTVDDIDPNIQSPNQMTRKWGRLGVIDKFISEKQKEKALDVSKELLVNEGRFEGLPYMWVHTNKYNSRIIPNFENVKDSRYKEFTDLGKIVAFFTNNEDMSKSYADQKSVLANTKKFNSIKEFNERFKDNSDRYISEISGNPVKGDISYEITIDENGLMPFAEEAGSVPEYVLHKKYDELIKYKSVDEMYRGVIPRNIVEGLSDSEKIQAVKKYAKDNFMGDEWGDSRYDGVEINRDGNDVIFKLRQDRELGRYKSEKQALANARSLINKEGYYHYKGIIQNVHNPLIVDKPNKYWNDLGNAYEALISTPDGKKGLSKIKRKMSEIKKGYEEIYDYLKRSWEAKKKLQEERGNAVDKIEAGKPETAVEAERLRNLISANTNGRTKIKNLFNEGTLEELTSSEAESEIGNGETMKDVWDKANKIYTKNKEFFDAIKRPANMLSTFERSYSMDQMAKFSDYIMKIGGFDAGDRSLFHNVLGGIIGEWIWDVDIEKRLKDKTLTTNDWVFYALKKGGYDGVLFRNIKDYGGKSIEGSARGGDVVAVFNSNQFKSWDNADPTDSKYISYQKMDSDEKNSDGKKLSNGQAEYFKDSKVRDENGNLLVVYHGTQAGDFTVYMHGKNGISNSLAKVGYRFTPSKQGALNFAKESWRGRSKPRADKVYLNITNPKIYEPRKIDLMSEEEKKVELDKEWDVYKEKKQKADAIDYTKAYGFFHDEYDHPIEERHLFATLSSQYEYAEKYNGKLGKYDPESMRWYSDKYGLDHDKIVKDVEEYERLKKEADEEYNKYLEMKISDPYDDFMYDIYKIDSNMDTKWTRKDLNMALNNYESPNKFREKLISEGYDGIIIKQTAYDGSVIGGGARNDQYVAFYSNQIKRTTNKNPTDNEDIRYQIAEYDYDENGKIKRLKFGDNSEFDPNIFGEPTKKELIEEDKEKEKNNTFYDAWMRYNAQNYEEDQLTMDEFLDGVMKWLYKQQDEYDQKMNDLSQAQNDPKMLELQLRAVKLMEEEGQVGKKFGKNVSKEVRAKQQAEVERKREQLIKDIFDWMYPGLRFEDATYDDQMRADEREAEWEMMGKEGIEEKLKYFKKDKNGNWEAKNIKIENPEEKWNKLVKSNNFDEIFTPVDRVLEWRTPQGQKGRLDRAKDPKKYKSVLEKINGGTTKTKVTLKDVTQEVRALEKYRAEQEAEKERKKKEKQEAMAKKKQDEYKKMVRMKAFQRLVDMQWFEKYPFLTEDEIKTRYGFTDDEWKTITEQQEIKLPKKWSEKAVSDFNKAVDSQVKALIEGLNWQNTMKRKDAEKNLGEIGDIDIDVLLGRDEEKGQKEVEEFEKLSEEKQPEDKNKKAQELTNKWKTDVQEMFRKAEEKRNERYANKEEKKIDEVKTVEEAKKLTKDNRWKRTKKFWKDTTIQDLIQPISSRIEKISPRIYLELMRFEQRIAIKENTRMKQVEDFVKKMAEIRSKNKKDYLNITLHLLNGNVGTANQMLEKYGTNIPRQVLDEIWADAEDVGYTMNYEGFYYPRKVKDVDDFLNRFAKVEDKNIQGEIDKIIRKKEKQAMERGEEFTPQMKADLINQLLMDGEVEGISLGSGHMKQRKVDSITKNMLEFYEDPVDALLQYITSMTEAVEKARFLGQGKRGDIKSLGEFIADEGITGYDADELKKLLLSRFNYAPMGDMMRGLKVSANIIHLGSPSSALSQLADVSFSLIENGLVNLVQGLTRKYNLDLDALGITNRGEEYKAQGKNETKWEKLQRFTFKLTGFNMMDQFGKKSFVVSTLNKLIKYAKKGDPQLRKDLERRFDDPKMIDEIIEDLKEGRMSENVNLFLFTKLADVQPLTRTQMTNTYLRAGNWRVLYAFKTFGIKQLDYIIQKSRRELQTKPTAKALWSIVTMLGIIMLCGAGDDELKDFSMGRKYSSWIWRMIEGNDWSASQLSDRFWDNFLKLLGFTKYSIYQARTQGIKSAIEDIFFSLPGLDLFTYPLQDIQDAMSEDGLDFSQASSWQLIPIVGKYGYWWAGAGQTKQQKSLGKKKKKSGSGSGPRSRA